MKTQEINKCRHFKSESEHFPPATNTSYWQGGSPTTRQYWCIQTMNTIGPDSGLVNGNYCKEGRVCFENNDDN